MRQRAYSRYPIEWLWPVIILVVVFTVYPFGYAIWTSLHRVLLVKPTTPFIGLKNYVQVFSSIYFGEALLNTLLFTVITTPIIVASALAVGRLLLTKFVGRGIVRAVVLLPWAMPGAVTGIVWVWIFHARWGILNAALLKLHLISSYIDWLDDPILAKLSVMVAHIWTQIPFASVLLMAALTTINRELYEAADVDGAGAPRKLFSITIPHIKGMLTIAVIYELIMGLTSYDLTYSMTGGGPGGATTLLPYYIWAESFKQLQLGRGAALGVILALVTLTLILGIMRAVPGELTVREE